VLSGTFNLFILNEYPKSPRMISWLSAARQSRRRNSRASSSPARCCKPIL